MNFTQHHCISQKYRSISENCGCKLALILVGLGIYTEAVEEISTTIDCINVSVVVGYICSRFVTYQIE